MTDNEKIQSFGDMVDATDKIAFRSSSVMDRLFPSVMLGSSRTA